MASVRQLAGCIGLEGDISIVRDFFGRASSPSTPLSMLTQAKRLEGGHFHLNLIRVAIDGGEWDVATDEFNIDEAVQSTREIFATVGLGIGRVLRFFIPAAESDGHEHLANSGSAADWLWDHWMVPNDGIDAFFVLTMGDHRAVSGAINGPCDNSGKGAGVAVAVRQMAIIKDLAHELGHYLGLRHVDSVTNLMDATEDTDHGGLELTPEQGDTMRDHCSVQPGC